MNYYIYYTQAHARKYLGMSVAQAMTQDVKREIIQNAIDSMSRRQSNFIDAAANSKDLTQEQKEALELVFDKDSWLKDINSGVDKDMKSGVELSFPTVEEAFQTFQSVVNSLDGDVSDLKTYADALDEFIDSLDDYLGRDTLNTYTRIVRDKFLYSSRTGSNSGKALKKSLLSQGYSPTTAGEAKIIQTIIGKYSGGVFKVDNTTAPGNTNGVTTKAERMSRALGQLATLSASLNMAYGENGNSELQGVIEGSDFRNKIVSLTRKLLQDSHSVMGEVSVAEQAAQVISGYKELDKQISKLDDILKVESTRRAGGNHVFAAYAETVLSGSGKGDSKKYNDKFMQDIASLDTKAVGVNLANRLEKLSHSTRFRKADVSLTVGGGESDRADVMSIGISVNDYDKVSFTDDGLGISKASIHLQSSTPFIALLLRDAAISTNDVVGIMNIAAARNVNPGPGGMAGRTDDTYTSEFNEAWENVKQQAAYRSLLSALAGSGEEYDNVFFMSVNGRVFAISDILQNVYDNISIANLGPKIGTSSSLLDRNVYQGLNVYVGKPYKLNRAEGLQRSDSVYGPIARSLYNAKISTNLDIANLINIFK